jgi:hypothetical protein
LDKKKKIKKNSQSFSLHASGLFFSRPFFPSRRRLDLIPTLPVPPPFPIVERVGKLAYRLELPNSMNGVHNVFHVSMLRK